MNKPTNEHPLIEDHPGDTLHRCADIVRFLMENETMDGIVQSGAADHGRYWILECVETALRHEGERAVEPQQPVRSVS